MLLAIIIFKINYVYLPSIVEKIKRVEVTAVFSFTFPLSTVVLKS